MCVDFPRGWQIARAVEPEYHHNECSFNVTRGGCLCDCDVLLKHAEYLDNTKLYGTDGVVLREYNQERK